MSKIIINIYIKWHLVYKTNKTLAGICEGVGEEPKLVPVPPPVLSNVWRRRPAAGGVLPARRPAKPTWDRLLPAHQTGLQPELSGRRLSVPVPLERGRVEDGEQNTAWIRGCNRFSCSDSNCHIWSRCVFSRKRAEISFSVFCKMDDFQVWHKSSLWFDKNSSSCFIVSDEGCSHTPVLNGFAARPAGWESGRIRRGGSSLGSNQVESGSLRSMKRVVWK